MLRKVERHWRSCTFKLNGYILSYQQIPVSKIFPQETHLIFVGISMRTSLLLLWWSATLMMICWHWMKDTGLHGLRTCGWFMVHVGLSGKHGFQTQVNGSIVKSCDEVFCNLHLLCCHVWNLTLCSYSRLQKEQIALLYFADLCKRLFLGP